MYDKMDAQSNAFTMRKLFNTKRKDGKPVAEQLIDFQYRKNQFNAMKIVFDDETQALILLSSLPSSIENLVISLSNSAPNGVLSLSSINNSLFDEENGRKEMAGDTTQAHVIEN